MHVVHLVHRKAQRVVAHEQLLCRELDAVLGYSLVPQNLGDGNPELCARWAGETRAQCNYDDKCNP